MKRGELANLSLAGLRDRLRARIEMRDNSDGLDLRDILSYYIALPAGSYTSEGADGLVQLARNFSFASQPVEMLDAASLASRMAIAAGDRLSLCRARNKEGFALAPLGRPREATIAQAQAWSLARELLNKKLEMFAIWGFSTVCVAMGQWNLAIRYCERMRALAEEMSLPYYEFLARTNIADCALQIRDAPLGLYVLSGALQTPAPSWMDSRLLSFLHINLGRLYLLVGNLTAAKLHSEEGTRWAAALGSESIVQLASALRGLVDVRLGEVETGLSAVIEALDFAKRANQAEVPSCLAVCIDAYEASGQLDKALDYLNELVDWKKRSIDAEFMALPFEGLSESAQLQTGSSLFDEGLIAKAHSLESGVRSQIERLTEIALNAEISSGYDLYRPFRKAKLARLLAEALGWHQQRIDSLVLAARLANIGMIAIPSRILLKRESLSGIERGIVRGHARYGAELRKSKLQVLEIACLVAEQHHERYDGTGYPMGLSGSAITEEARIVSICDVFDAMTHNRPWRAPLGIQTSLAELERSSGLQFESSFVRTFAQMIRSEFWQPGHLDACLAEGAGDLEYVRAHARMEALFDEQRETRSA